MARRNVDPWDIARIEAQAPDDVSIPAARKVLAKGGFGTVERRADGSGWWANCKGLQDTYSVTVSRDDFGGVQAKCTCLSFKKPCKHALALLIYLAENPAARPDDAADATPTPAPASGFEPLLRAVFAAPADDTPRLVFADWLDENGQPDRAALIRTQCAVAELPQKSPKRKPLAAEEAVLVAAVTAGFGLIPKPYKLTLGRGFGTLEHMNWRDRTVRNPGSYPERFLALYRDGWVETLRFNTSFDTIPLAVVPILHLIGTLDLSAGLVTDNGCRQIARKLRPGDPDVRLARVLLRPTDEERVQAHRAERVKKKPAK